MVPSSQLETGENSETEGKRHRFISNNRNEGCKWSNIEMKSSPDGAAAAAAAGVWQEQTREGAERTKAQQQNGNNKCGN